MHTIRAGDCAFGAAAAFMAGVFAANEGWNMAVVALCAGTVIWSACVFVLSVRNALRWAALAAAVCIAGGFYYFTFTAWRTAHTKLPQGKQAAFFGVVTEEPKPAGAGRYLFFPASLDEPYSGAVDIFASSRSDFHYGDLVWIEGSIEPPTAGSDEIPAVFYPKAHLVTPHRGWEWKEWLISLKAAIAAKFAALLPPDQAALMTAIVLGAPSAVGAQIKERMEASGTTYITGMYGFKIAIIAAALETALKDHLPRWWLIGITAAAVALFVAASGANISVMRAAVMGAFMLAARATGRAGNPRNALTLSAFAMVLADPVLMTDAAFQLSFLSYWGIFYLKDPIDSLFGWRDEGFLQWKQHAMLSLTTNLAILPVVMNTFGAFSLTSFLSNIFIMIPWIAVLACGAFIAGAGAIAMPLAFVGAKVAGLFLLYESFIITIFAKIAVPMPAVFGSAPAIVFYYGLLIIFAHYFRRDRGAAMRHASP